MFKAIKTVDGTDSSSVSIDSDRIQRGYEYNYPKLLGEGVDGSSNTNLTESLEEDEELMAGIERAKGQVLKGELASYDEVF